MTDFQKIKDDLYSAMKGGDQFSALVVSYLNLLDELSKRDQQKPDEATANWQACRTPQRGDRYIDSHSGKKYTFDGEKFVEECDKPDEAAHPYEGDDLYVIHMTSYRKIGTCRGGRVVLEGET